MPFQPESIRRFQFLGWEFDESSAMLRLDYAFDREYHFSDHLTFPGALLPLSPARRAALEPMLDFLHWVAGVSYYKAAAPGEIKIQGRHPDRRTAAFLDTLYLHGLGEFAYRNGLNLEGRIHFPRLASEPPPERDALILPRRAILPLGGGKDSLVSLAILQAGGQTPALFSVGDPPVIRRVAEQIGLPRIIVQRRLDPLLFELNENGAYNGHVPVTGVIAAILGVCAVLYGFDTVVMSNERSAEYGNLVTASGFEVNHQYSKSLSFERALSAQFQQRLPGLRYFSLLRPLSELAISRLFARDTTYHGVFSSCNGNFRVRPDRREPPRWCLNCPKCRFVFLALAPFMDKKHLLEIFGANLLDDPAQLPGFLALLGEGAHKPFECVGEEQESRLAFHLLAQQAAWQDDHAVKHCREHLPPLADAAALEQEVFGLSDQHLVPELYLDWLENYNALRLG